MPVRPVTAETRSGAARAVSPVDLTATEDHPDPVAITDVKLEEYPRLLTGIAPLDRVMGGGIVPGSLTLIAGGPGAGKSTLLIQAVASVLVEDSDIALYVTGEETLPQVAMRAQRVNAADGRIKIVPETDLDRVMAHASRLRPKIMVVDSVQVMALRDIGSLPGSAVQVKACTGRLMAFAKSTGISTILVGHVTKSNVAAGPKALEHLVDSVLMFAKVPDSEYRVLRTPKNRFGATSEVGGFEMVSDGLIPADVDLMDLDGSGIYDEDDDQAMIPIAQELFWKFQELGGEIDPGLRDRIAGRLDMNPRGSR